MAGSRLASVPPADSGVRGELVEAEHAAGELKRTIARTLIAGARGVDGLASGVPVLGEAAVALDSAIRPGLRYTAMYPSRIDPSLPPDALPSILEGMRSPAERAERERLVREAAVSDAGIPSDADLAKFDKTVGKLVAHLDALVAPQ